MIRTFCAAFTGAALLIGTVAHAAAPLNSLHIAYRETLTPAKGKPMSRTSEMWLKNNKMKVRQGDLYVVSNGKKSYIYSPKDPQKRMQVTNVPPGQQAASVSAQISQMISPLLKRMKKVGTGTVLGYPVDVYQISDPKQKASNKTWVAKTIGAPIFLREERKGPQGTLRIEATALKVNPVLADRTFAAPTGYKAVTAPPAPRGKAAPPAKR
ncbi:MAG: hypothetical protein KY468_07125 [Armatimonadetes bacterium]|nr:hypothetical protein [Armatimonadota bacterium]